MSDSNSDDERGGNKIQKMMEEMHKIKLEDKK